MKYKGIELFPEPTYGGAKMALALPKKWSVAHIPINKLNPKKEFDVALQEYMFEHPDLLAEFEEFEADIERYQMVMVCTNLTYQQVVALENKFTISEYNELLRMCKDILGEESVKDFLQRLKASMSSPPDKKPKDTSPNE